VRLIAKENGGVASALNAAFSVSRGDIISLLDADDKWLPFRLELVIKTFLREHPLPGLVMHPLRVINTNGRVLKDRHPARLDCGWLAEQLLQGTPLSLAPATGLSFHKEVARKIFPLPVELRTWADRALYERATLLSTVVAIDKVLGIYRQHGANVTGASGATTVTAIAGALNQIERILRLRAEFASQVYGVQIRWEDWYVKETSHYQLARALLEGHNVPINEIVMSANGRYAWLWVILFKLVPRKSAIRIFQWWWGEGVGKRWARATARLLRFSR
jgi:glycosyltransferase involved in cell wall biosynthesis